MIRPQFMLDLNHELIIDFFAGGGGASTGIELGLRRHVDIACNHAWEAILTHSKNHPQTRHYLEDVFHVNPHEATQGRSVGFGWFSPDCTHFSRAKGKKPKNKLIRGLAWVMVKWAAYGMRCGILENVEEFLDWCPLLPDGNPDNSQKGRTFRAFVAVLTTGIDPEHPDLPEIMLRTGLAKDVLVKGLGYVLEYRRLRACDFGAPTTRRRLFVIIRRDGRPIVWPEPTHAAPKEAKALKLKPWRSAAECIDWTIPCKSIFGRKKPLAEATMRRIAKGIWKFVINNANPFIVKVNHSEERFRGQEISDPMATVTGTRGSGLVVPILTEHANASNQRNLRVDEPMRTICAQVKGGHFAVVAPTIVNTANSKTTGRAPNTWSPEEPVRTVTAVPGIAVAAATLVQTGYGEAPGQDPRALDIGAPLGTVVASGQKHAAVAAMLTKYHGERREGEARGVLPGEPLHTISTENRFGVVSAFLAKHFTGSDGSAAEDPVHTITARDHNALIAAHLQRQFGNSVGSPADAPAGTVMADGLGKTALMAAQLVGCGGRAGQSRPRDAGEPVATITSKADTCLVASNLIKLKGTCPDGQPVDEPLHTVQAGGTHFAEVRALLIHYYSGGGQIQDITDPMHTITTEDRIGLVTIEGVDYAITDIGMRMLEPHELFAAQGFPSDYIISPEYVNSYGRTKRLSKSAQVRLCGNSVCPPVAAALVKANVPEMAYHDERRRAA